MRKILGYFSISLSDAFAYRAVGFIWMLVDVGPAIVALIFWNAAFKTSSIIGSYSLQGMLFYYLGIMLVKTLVATHPQYDLYRQIRSGGFSKYLIKPFNLTSSKIVDAISWRLIRFVYLLPLIVYLIIYLFNLNQSFSFLNINFFFLFFSLIMAFLINFFIKMVLGLATFWFTEPGWLFFAFSILNSFFGGELVPIDLFPPTFFGVVDLLPFKYMLFFPLSIALNKYSFQESIIGLIIQFSWCLFFFFIYKLVLKKGVKVYEAYGS